MINKCLPPTPYEIPRARARRVLSRVMKRVWYAPNLHILRKEKKYVPLKRSAVAQYLRHIRGAWRRHPRLQSLPDPQTVPMFSDLRKAAQRLQRTQPVANATPMAPHQLKQLIDHAPHFLRRYIAILAAVGAARCAEMTHPQSYMKVLQEAVEVKVFPKGGRTFKLATIPRNNHIDRYMNITHTGQVLQPIAPRNPLRMINLTIRTAAQRHQWPRQGRWSSYSIRHGMMALAFQTATEAQVRVQTGHARAVPFTYQQHRNPHREVQLQVVTPVFQQVMQPSTPLQPHNHPTPTLALTYSRPTDSLSATSNDARALTTWKHQTYPPTLIFLATKPCRRPKAGTPGSRLLGCLTHGFDWRLCARWAATQQTY